MPDATPPGSMNTRYRWPYSDRADRENTTTGSPVHCARCRCSCTYPPTPAAPPACRNSRCCVNARRRTPRTHSRPAARASALQTPALPSPLRGTDAAAGPSAALRTAKYQNIPDRNRQRHREMLPRAQRSCLARRRRRQRTHHHPSDRQESASPHRRHCAADPRMRPASSHRRDSDSPCR